MKLGIDGRRPTCIATFTGRFLGPASRGKFSYRMEIPKGIEPA